MQNEQIFLFTGENSFALEDERHRWEEGFRQKYGADNLDRLPGAKMTVRDLLNEIGVAPFLSPKRLVVIEGVPKLTKEDVARLVAGIHPAVVVLFVDIPGSRQKSGAKELSTIATVKTFPELTTSALRVWVEKRAKEEGASMEAGVLDRLITILGGDQQLIAMELRTLALRSTGRTITLADVEEMVLPVEGVIWTVTDALAAGRSEQALRAARELLARGTEPFALWNSILSFVRNVVAVQGALQGGSSDPKAISERSGVHIFAIRSLLPCAKRISAPALRRVVDQVVSFDSALKTGGLRATDESPDELLAAVDTVLLQFP